MAIPELGNLILDAQLYFINPTQVMKRIDKDLLLQMGGKLYENLMDSKYTADLTFYELKRAVMVGMRQPKYIQATVQTIYDSISSWIRSEEKLRVNECIRNLEKQKEQQRLSLQMKKEVAQYQLQQVIADGIEQITNKQ